MAVAFEEAEGVELVVGLPAADFELRELLTLPPSVVGERFEPASRAGREGVECLADAVVLLPQLGGGQGAHAGASGFV